MEGFQIPRSNPRLFVVYHSEYGGRLRSVLAARTRSVSSDREGVVDGNPQQRPRRAKEGLLHLRRHGPHAVAMRPIRKGGCTSDPVSRIATAGGILAQGNLGPRPRSLGTEEPLEPLEPLELLEPLEQRYRVNNSWMGAGVKQIANMIAATIASALRPGSSGASSSMTGGWRTPNANSMPVTTSVQTIQLAER
jgi:hypothetical protein